LKYWKLRATKSLHPYKLGFRSVLLQGGGKRNEESRKLEQGVDVVIATPQRALEHIEARHIDMKALKHLVVDEADMMFDMGFVSYLEKIFAMMTERSQKVIVSATITPRVVKLAKTHIQSLRRIELDPPGKIADTVTQMLYPVVKSKKSALLAWLISSHNLQRVLVFVRKKELANGVAEALRAWDYKVGILHGERMHQERKKALRAFREGSCQILVATDIAARGKSRGYLMQAPQRRRRTLKPDAGKSAVSPLNKKGKKRKTTKRDGFKILDANKRQSSKSGRRK